MYWKDYFLFNCYGFILFFCMTCSMSLFLIVSTLVGRAVMNLHFFSYETCNNSNKKNNYFTVNANEIVDISLEDPYHF